jgi:hypothetical protein
MNLSAQSQDFQSQKLIVDYISFKFRSFDDNQERKIWSCLFELGFNSYQTSAKLSKPIKIDLLVTRTNQYEVVIVQDHQYWDGTLVQFSGLNASRFYSLAKEKRIDWTIFSSAILSRFDIYYSRENNPQDKISSSEFLQNSYAKLKQTIKTIHLEKNPKGMILKIGNRRSNNYSRIYQKQDSLRFELEMKGKILQNYYLLLVQNSFEEFEEKMYSHFILYFGKLLPLQYSHTDWLVVQLRPIRKQYLDLPAFNSDYIESEIKSKLNINSKSIVKLIQFLNFAQDLDYQITNWDGVEYRKVTCIVRDFIKFQNPTVSRTNRYQLKQTKEFFEEVQTGILQTSFTSTHFQSLVAIPRVEYETNHQKQIIANVWVVEKLFYYDYPFYFPNFFEKNLTKHEFDVRFALFQTFCSIHIEKVVLVKQFIDSYPSALNNSQKTKIKEYFIEGVKILQENRLIEPNYKVISNGQLYEPEELTLKNISEGFVICEKLSISD